MKRGDMVKFAVPTDDYERAARYLVKDVLPAKPEVNLPAEVEIMLICDLHFKPWHTVLLADVELVETAENLKEFTQ